MRVARASVIVSAVSLLVTVTSFANQLVIAWAFGASSGLDEYLQATSIPMLATGAITAVFAYAMVPALMRARVATDDPTQAVSAFFTVLTIAGAIISACGILLAPLFIRLLNAGVASPGAVLSARIAWCSAGLGMLTGFLAAVMNVHGRFVEPVLVSALPSLGGIAFVLLLGKEAGTPTIAAGLLTGTLLATLLMLAMIRGEIRWSRPRGPHLAEVRRFAVSAPAVLLSALIFSTYQTVDAFWAPRLGPANLSILAYCHRLLIAIGTVLAAGPSVILQPRLAASAVSGDHGAFQHDLSRALRLTVLIAAPVAAWVSLCAAPILRVAFERGAFQRTETLAVSSVIPLMLFAMVPLLCTIMMFKAFYARSDVLIAAVLGVLGPCLYFLFSGALVRYGVRGIGAAYALTWSAIALAGMLRLRDLPQSRERSGPSLMPSTFVLVSVCLLLGWITRHVLLADWEHAAPMSIVVRLGVGGVVTLAVYAFVALRLLKIEELRLLMAAVTNR